VSPVSSVVSPPMVVAVLGGNCSPCVHADAQRDDAEMKIGPDHLVGGGDHPDWWRDKALHRRLDRASVNGHVRKAEPTMFIRYFSPGRGVTGTGQRDACAFASETGSVTGRQRHGADNRGARTDTSDRGRGNQGGGECRRDQDIDLWPHLTPLLHAAADDSDGNPTGAPSRTSCETAIPWNALRVSTMFRQ
jgi:hypothetical protein